MPEPARIVRSGVPGSPAGVCAGRPVFAAGSPSPGRERGRARRSACFPAGLRAHRGGGLASGTAPGPGPQPERWPTPAAGAGAGRGGDSAVLAAGRWWRERGGREGRGRAAGRCPAAQPPLLAPAGAELSGIGAGGSMWRRARSAAPYRDGVCPVAAMLGSPAMLSSSSGLVSSTMQEQGPESVFSSMSLTRTKCLPMSSPMLYGPRAVDLLASMIDR